MLHHFQIRTINKDFTWLKVCFGLLETSKLMRQTKINQYSLWKLFGANEDVAVSSSYAMCCTTSAKVRKNKILGVGLSICWFALWTWKRQTLYPSSMWWHKCINSSLSYNFPISSLVNHHILGVQGLPCSLNWRDRDADKELSLCLVQCPCKSFY